MSPPDHSGKKSALVVIEGRASVRAIALDAGDMDRFVGPAFDAENHARITMFLYDVPLEALDFPPGELRTADVTAPVARPLPATTAVYQSEVEPGGFEWTALGATPGRLESLRLAATPLGDCLSGGGCYATLERAAELWCTTPCPASPAIEPNGTPSPPVPPVLTWSAPPRVACAADEVQWADAERCAPIAPCPSGVFAGGLPPGTIHCALDRGSDPSPGDPPASSGTACCPTRRSSSACSTSPAAACTCGGPRTSTRIA